MYVLSRDPIAQGKAQAQVTEPPNADSERCADVSVISVSKRRLSGSVRLRTR